MSLYTGQVATPWGGPVTFVRVMSTKCLHCHNAVGPDTEFICLADPYAGVLHPTRDYVPAALTPPYRLVVADPPWKYTQLGNGAARNHYECLTKDELAALSPMTAPNCALLMWTTGPMMDDAIELMERWGFEYKTVAFVWEKLTQRNSLPFFGLGSYTRSSAEFVLLGVRGSVTQMVCSHSVRQVFTAPVREHSRKPDVFFQLVDELFGTDGHRLEMFAREKRPGWDYFGNELAFNEVQ